MSLLDVTEAIRNLTQLQSLVLSGLGLSGPLDNAHRAGLDTFQELRHIDLSHNPSINGSLPSSWYSLAALRVINISHTGITGRLPSSYAALQQLKEFRASNCTGVIGQLPPTWGLLKLEVLEVTNSALTGTLPPEWVDAAALQQTVHALQLRSRTIPVAQLQLQRFTMIKHVPVPEAESITATPLNLEVATTEPTASETAGALAGPATLGMLNLRVLDLSVAQAAAVRRGMSGTLPASFAALEQLQVSMCTTALCRIKLKQATWTQACMGG
jgi:hypothetical protein